MSLARGGQSSLLEVKNQNESNSKLNNVSASVSYDAATCNHKLSFFPSSQLAKEEKQQAWLIKLNECVVRADLKAVKNMLNDTSNYCLLTESARVKGDAHGGDGVCQEFEGTPYGLALATGNVKFYGDKGIVEIIEDALCKLPNGGEEVLKQRRAQFPNGWEKEERARQEADDNALLHVFKAIEESNKDEDCQEELKKFKEHVRDSNISIKTGKQFNDKLLLDALSIHISSFDSFGGPNSRKNKLFWCHVIGYIQRFMPAKYGHLFCQGLWHVIEAKWRGIEKQSFQFLDLLGRPSGGVLVPLDSDPSFRLGYHYAVDLAGNCRESSRDRNSLVNTVAYLTRFLDRNNDQMNERMPSSEEGLSEKLKFSK